MRKPILFSFGLLISVLLGCTDPSGPGVDPYSPDTWDASIFGGSASISIEKWTNGQDADEAPGTSITPGDPVVWEYRVKNTGTEELRGVWVSDDQEGFICENLTLAVGQDYLCTKNGVAQAGPYANVGTVFGYGSRSLVSADDWSHYTGETSKGAPAVQVVAIQIKPGGVSPCVNESSRGRTPVAILASPEFDPLRVDPATIRAGGLTAPVRWGRGEDVNGDGLLDLVVHFKTQELNAAGLLQDGVELVISGETFEGGSFTGSDLIRLAGGPFCR